MRATNQKLITTVAALAEHLDPKIAASARTIGLKNINPARVAKVANQLRWTARNPEPIDDVHDMTVQFDQTGWALAEQLREVRLSVIADWDTTEVSYRLSQAAQQLRTRTDTAADDPLVTLLAEGANPDVVDGINELLSHRPQIQPARKPQRSADRALNDAARDEYLTRHIDTHIATLTVEEPWIRSVGLLVSQYWDDEAHDAVHANLIVSQHQIPDLEALYDHDELNNHDAFYSNSATIEYEDLNLPDEVRARTHKDRWKSRRDQYSIVNIRADGRYETPRWDDNYRAIELFAPYCTPGSQESSTRENDRPYCLWQRQRNGSFKRVVTGVQLRPWLDGCSIEDDDAA